MNKTLGEALQKMPDSKMIFINPDDEAVLAELPEHIKIRKNALIQKGTFVLSEKDLEEELKKAIEEIKPYF